MLRRGDGCDWAGPHQQVVQTLYSCTIVGSRDMTSIFIYVDGLSLKSLFYETTMSTVWLAVLILPYTTITTLLVSNSSAGRNKTRRVR